MERPLTVAQKGQRHIDCFIELCPDDILLRIFETIIGIPDDFRRGLIPTSPSSVVISLSHVCYRWRSIMLSPLYASFWARISTSSKKITRVFLERSHQALLDVQLEDAQCELLDLILPHSDRLGQFHIHLASPFEHYLSLLDFSAPRMSSLGVGLWSHRGNHPSLSFSGNNLQSLRKLDLLGISLSRQHGFTKLTHLSLHHSLNRIEEVLPILEDNPNLQELLLFDQLSPTSQEPSHRIQLPHLRFVHLDGSGDLLKYIQLPRKVGVSLRSTALTMIVLPPITPYLTLRIQGTARTLPPPTFTALGDQCCVSSTISTTRIIEPAIFDHMLLHLIDKPRNLAHLKELWLYECQFPQRLALWKSVLAVMPSLHKISVGPGSCIFIINSLFPDERGLVPCPNLRELHLLHSLVPVERLPNLVEERSKSGCPLRKIEIYIMVSLKQEVVDRLKQDVEDVRVVVQPFSQPVPAMDVPIWFKEVRRGRVLR